MKLSLPYWPKRRYLTGMDWVIGALHQSARRGGGAGAVSQAVLEIDGRVDAEALRAALDKISARFPLIHGKTARDRLNLAPYWKVPSRGSTAAIPLRVVELAASETAKAQRLLDEHVNTPLGSGSRHLSLLLVRVGQDRSRLGLVFDHRLFDAFGAEAFLRLIDQTWEGRLEEIAPRVRQSEPAHLDHWQKRFRSGRTINQFFLRLREREICVVGHPEAARSPRRIRYLHESLSLEQTEAFNQTAGTEIGVPILLPSAAARAVLAVRRVFPPGIFPGERHLVFTTTSTRVPGQEWESLFFNPLSYLAFFAERGQADSAGELAGGFRDQLFELMKLGVPEAMADAATLGRIFPFWLVNRLMRSIGRGRLCSLYFACLRESGFPPGTFLGVPVSNLVHWPPAFSPPGVNLCMTSFGGRFNLVLSYVEGTLSDGEAAAVMREFKRLLTQGI